MWAVTGQQNFDLQLIKLNGRCMAATERKIRGGGRDMVLAYPYDALTMRWLDRLGRSLSPLVGVVGDSHPGRISVCITSRLD